MHERVRLTPLTPEEQLFSEENYLVFEKCVNRMHLDDEQQSEAALAYLHAIKKWYARPDLHRYAFCTVLRWTIKSRLSGCQQKADRRIWTVSLEDAIPGTEGLCYGDQITYEHMDYLYQREEDPVSVKFEYNVMIPKAERLGSMCVETEKLLEFLGSNHKNMKITYSEDKAARSKISTIRAQVTRSGRKDIRVRKIGTCIFIEKVAKSKGKEKG